MVELPLLSFSLATAKGNKQILVLSFNFFFYESANSLVYRGVREGDDEAVILKVLKEDYPTPEELRRYKQEYDITRNLNFSGVIKAYGLEPYQRTLAMILEDFGA